MTAPTDPLSLGDGNRPMVYSAMHLFTHPGQVARMVLADGFRFMALVRDEPPQMIPITESGEWEIDLPIMLAKGRYPVGIVAIDAAHVKAFETIPGHVITEMLEASAKAAIVPPESAR